MSNKTLFFPQILYHVHKHLIDGLYPLADELAKVICSSSSPILSPIDRIDAFDALNAIFNSAALNVHFDTQELEQRERELSFVKVRNGHESCVDDGRCQRPVSLGQ